MTFENTFFLSCFLKEKMRDMHGCRGKGKVKFVAVF